MFSMQRFVLNNFQVLIKRMNDQEYKLACKWIKNRRVLESNENNCGVLTPVGTRYPPRHSIAPPPQLGREKEKMQNEKLMG